MSAKDLADYRGECKRVLRELWLLLHPDKLEHHPAYSELTDAQKRKLRELWHDVMAIRSEELGFDSSQLGHDYRSLPILLDARDTARAILANSGIDTDVQLIIRGDTLGEQLDWLTEATARLEHEIDNVQAQMKALLEDEAMQEKVAFLGCSSDQQERVRGEMRARTREYRREADDLQHILETRFGSGAIA